MKLNKKIFLVCLCTLMCAVNICAPLDNALHIENAGAEELTENNTPDTETNKTENETEKECEHTSLKVLSEKKPSFDKEGYREELCECGYAKKTTIAAVKKPVLSDTKYVHDGKVKKPTLTVKDSAGKTLKEGTDYSTTYSSGRKNIGKYSVTVTLKGKYEGKQTSYFTILPKAPSSASAVLYGKDDVKFSWSKSSGASGYAVYYKKDTSSKYTFLCHTTKTSVSKADLADGVKYQFKVVPYKTIDGTKYESTANKVASVYTLKKMDKPTVSRSSNSSVTVKWTDIPGQSGYQISKSTKKDGTNIVSTYSTTSGTSKKLEVSLNKTYYYKVRAYKTVDGKKIYGPWSDVVSYKNVKTWTHKDSTSKITITKEWYQNAWCYIAHLEFTDYDRLFTRCGNEKYGSKETIKHVADRLDTILSVNGCYSSPNLNYPVVRDGKVYNNKKNAYLPAVYSQKTGLFQSAWDNGGTPGIVGKELKTLVKEGKVTDTFCFGPPILINGKVENNKDTSRAQRTFIGTNGKAGDVLIVVSDGRYVDGESSGLTYKQCAQLLKNKGCNFGVPLDGGGSSTMVFKGKTLNKTSGRAVVDSVNFK